MPTDPTVLHQAAQGVLDALLAGAENTGWEVSGCVTVGEPSIDCDQIMVWVSQVNPIQTARCSIASQVRVSFYLGSCIGSALREDCAFWEDRSPEHYDRIWSTWIALVDAALDGTLCSGVTCADITLGLLTAVPGGDVGLWRGSVDIVLSPRSGS